MLMSIFTFLKIVSKSVSSSIIDNALVAAGFINITFPSILKAIIPSLICKRIVSICFFWVEISDKLVCNFVVISSKVSAKLSISFLFSTWAFFSFEVNFSAFFINLSIGFTTVFERKIPTIMLIAPNNTKEIIDIVLILLISSIITSVIWAVFKAVFIASNELVKNNPNPIIINIPNIKNINTIFNCIFFIIYYSLLHYF